MEQFKLFVRWLIFNDKNEVLLIQHKKSDKITSLETLLIWWEIDFWENSEEALKREVFEEVWLEIIDMELCDTKTMILWNTHWFWVYYICKTKNLDFKNKEPGKHLRVYWWWVDDLWKQWKEVLEKVLQNRNVEKLSEVK